MMHSTRRIVLALGGALAVTLAAVALTRGAAAHEPDLGALTEAGAEDGTWAVTAAVRGRPGTAGEVVVALAPASALPASTTVEVIATTPERAVRFWLERAAPGRFVHALELPATGPVTVVVMTRAGGFHGTTRFVLPVATD